MSNQHRGVSWKRVTMAVSRDVANTSRQQPLWIDLAASVLLAMGLMIVLLFDVSSYNRQQTQGTRNPDFALMQARASITIGNSQFLPAQADAVVRMENFLPQEGHHHDLFRFALGPISTIEIYSSRVHAHLNFRFNNLVASQELTVRCNEDILDHFAALPISVVARTYQLSLHQGCNRFTVSYARYNHAGADFTPNDPRPIAGSYSTLDLFLD